MDEDLLNQGYKGFWPINLYRDDGGIGQTADGHNLGFISSGRGCEDFHQSFAHGARRNKSVARATQT